MSPALRQALAELPVYLAAHLRITVLALGLALLVGFPLALGVVRRPRARYIALMVVGIIQTIPGLALLALMVPLMAVIRDLLIRTTGIEISVLGLYPALAALTLYSLLPIVRNTVTGILGIDPTIVEAARGLGMSDRQILQKVEIPLAAPVLLAGVRTAAVWVVGTATLGTPVGLPSLGYFIFSGLQNQRWSLLLVGCVSAALLAVLLDALLALLEKGVATRSRRRTGLSLVGLAALTLLGLSSPLLSRGSSPAGDRPYVVGSKPFTEQYILAELMADRLQSGGLATSLSTSLGSNFGLEKLTSGEVDVFVDYTGTLWSNALKRQGSAPRERVLSEVSAWLRQERGILLLGPLGFENAYALATRRELAERLRIRTLEVLARHAPDLELGSDYEFSQRPEWEAVRDAYGLSFARTAIYDPTFLYQAAAKGEVDVISAYTTDGRVDTFDLVLLEDPRQVIPPYDAVILLSARAAADPRVVAALKPLLGSIDAATMRKANGRIDSDPSGPTPRQVARDLAAEMVALP